MSKDYSKACIYKICCKNVEIKDVYVGSTTNLAQRRNAHKTKCQNERSKAYTYPVYQFIRDNGGFDNWEVIKVQDAECNCSEDLLKIERACMERLGATLNKQVPGQSDKEYYKANKTEIARKQKEYKQVKVTCECGSVVSKNNIATHRKSKKHQDFIATQTEE